MFDWITRFWNRLFGGKAKTAPSAPAVEAVTLNLKAFAQPERTERWNYCMAIRAAVSLADHAGVAARLNDVLSCASVKRAEEVLLRLQNPERLDPRLDAALRMLLSATRTAEHQRP